MSFSFESFEEIIISKLSSIESLLSDKIIEERELLRKYNNNNNNNSAFQKKQINKDFLMCRYCKIHTDIVWVNSFPNLNFCPNCGEKVSHKFDATTDHNANSP